MSHLTTCEDSRSATSSPELASGLIPCASPDGLTINQSGPVPVRARLSARQAKEMGLLTSGTFGPTSSTSSASADLSMSLANRLQAVTQTRFDLVQADLEGMEYAFGLVPFTSAGIGAPHIRERAYWVAESISEQRQKLLPGLEKGNSEEGGWPPAKPSGLCSAGGMGDTNLTRLEGLGGNDSAAGWKGQTGPATPPGVHMRALEVNGFWRDADWLLCRDGKWRPVEPGTFPLVDGAAARLGRVESGVARVASSNRVGRLKG